MSLHLLLTDCRNEILTLAELKTVQLGALRPVSDELKRGLPLFFDQLIAVLLKNNASVSVKDETELLGTAGKHGADAAEHAGLVAHEDRERVGVEDIGLGSRFDIY
jgi:hypothetical protein